MTKPTIFKNEYCIKYDLILLQNKLNMLFANLVIIQYNIDKVYLNSKSFLT